MASSFQQKRYITVDDLGFPDVDVIESEYTYRQNIVHNIGSTPIIRPSCASIQFNTVAKPKKTGVMVVGLGGNNGSTFTGALIANKNGLTWETKRGTEKSNYFGSVTQASTAHVGTTPHGQQVYTPLHKLVPMLDPNELCVGGWDINGENLANAMSRAEVYPIDLQRQLRPLMEGIVPLPGIYYPHFIAGNQENRANNTLDGDHACMAHVEKLRADIRDFKEKNGLDAVILLGSANTERFAEIRSGLNTTADELLESIEDGNPEVSPSTVYAVAGALEGCAYINGSPQNTFVPGMIELAQREGIFIAGDDFKSGQTKIKSVLVDFLISAGIKVESIVSYNHLGNNDGKNLNEPKQFRSKEISKSNVVDDMVEKNSILYEDGEHPDHIVVIKYCPFVKDSKRAMDEYTSRIFMNGMNTISMHNTCEDSLLATPLMVDLVVLTELCQRVTYGFVGEKPERKFHTILSVLSYLLKAPLVKEGSPVVNALAAQRNAIVNLLKALRGLHPSNDMMLEHKIDSDLVWKEEK